MKVPSQTVKGNLRTPNGKVTAKHDRKAGWIPCVIYGGDANVHFNTQLAEVRHLIFTPDFKLADIHIGEDHYSCLIKEIQLHPVTNEIVHIDFLQLVKGRKVVVDLPLRTRGSSPGVKVGGKLILNVRKIKVKTTQEHLLPELLLDISTMELGDVIRVKDIDVEKGIEVLMNPSIPVAMVEIPRALKAAKA